MSSTDALLALFVALAFALALALVWSHWPRWAKALLVLVTTVSYFAAERTLDGVWGWPSRDALPERFVLLAVVIDEPRRNDPGALYVWVNAIEHGKPSKQPRAYRLPYAKDLHALLDEGMKKTRQGMTQMGSSEPKLGKRAFPWLRPGADEQQVKIRDLPSPQLPEK